MRDAMILFCLILTAGCQRSLDVPVDGGSCPAGSDPIACAGGPILYCCAKNESCDPPSCLDAGGGPAEPAASTDAAMACPPGQYLLIPCCGGFNDTSCSNGSPAPAPFCVDLPPACQGGQPSCTIGDCSGVLDGLNYTLQCECI